MILKQKHYLVALLLMALALLIASFISYSLPRPVKIEGFTLRFDYLLHVLSCYALTLVLMRVLFFKKAHVSTLLLSALLAMLYALLLELLQILAPTRSFSFRDLFFGGIGVVLASLSGIIFFRRLIR